MRKRLFDVAGHDPIVKSFLEQWLNGQGEWLDMIRMLCNAQAQECQYFKKLAGIPEEEIFHPALINIDSLSEGSVIDLICLLSDARAILIERGVSKASANSLQSNGVIQ